MKLSNWIRQAHRWISILFVLIVAAIFLVQGLGREIPEWVYLIPLLPLFLLILTGLYMFVLPYVRRRRQAA